MGGAQKGHGCGIVARTPDAEAWQLSAIGRKDYVTPEAIRVAPALELLETLV